MEKSVRVGEREYSKKMAELNRGFEVRCGPSIVHAHPYLRILQAVGQSFTGMENKMNEVGRTAIRVGMRAISCYDNVWVLLMLHAM